MKTDNNGWISVKDRLPEIGEHHVSKCVLCYCKGKAYVFSELEENCFGQVGFSCEKPDIYGEQKYEVTHWQPLPEPPKGA